MKTTTKKLFQLKYFKNILLISLFLIFGYNSYSQVPCAASFTYVANGNQVTFTNTSTPAGNYSYYWQFNDANGATTSTQQNPINTFNPSWGWGYACLTIMDSLNNCFDTYCDTIYLNGSQGPCTANFTYSVSGNQVTFTNTSTPAGNYSYYWTFGNSGTSTQQNPTYTFNNTGWHYVCLYISDSANNCFDTYCDTVYISSTGPCQSIFSFTINGNQVTFTNNSTGSGAGNLNYYWWFGDGTSSTAQTPTHTYPGNGTYTVCLTVWDSICLDSVCQTLTIGNSGPCTPDFTYVVNGNQVTFTNTSTGSGAGSLGYSWDFGDNLGWSTQQHPSYTYANSGTYTVCLYIWDSICSDTICKTITVGPNGIEEFSSIESVDVYPNPMSTNTTISYIINENTKVEVSIVDVLGKTISVLESQSKLAGKHTLVWNAESISSGMYMLSIKTHDKQIVKKVIVK